MSSSAPAVVLWPSQLSTGSDKKAGRNAVPSKAERNTLTSILSFHHQENRQCIVLTGETRHYRAAARAIPRTMPAKMCGSMDDGGGGNDRLAAQDNEEGAVEVATSALEIGCAYGDCLDILYSRCGGNVLGIDKSDECVEATKQRFPHLVDKARVLDCFLSDDSAALKEVAAGWMICMVDIGGVRHAEAVVKLVVDSLAHIPIVVVKARILYNKGSDLCAKQVKDGEVEVSDGVDDHIFEASPHISRWWEDVASKTIADGESGLGVPRWARKNHVRKAELT